MRNNDLCTYLKNWLRRTSLSLRVNELLGKYNSTSTTLKENNTNLLISHLRLNMKKIFSDHQLMLINTNKKLNFYASFKKEISKSKIVDLIINPQHKIAVNKFRLGNHSLHIETGRHTTPKTPIHRRICPFCQSDEIEDERHILFSCSFYDEIRTEITNKITLKYPLSKDLDLNSKTLFLFNNVDPFICKLISAFNIRHEILYKTK